MKNPISAILPDNTTIRDKHRWTAADFFSTYRYWALFIAFFLIEWTSASFWPCVQIALHAKNSESGFGAVQIALVYKSFFVAQNLGWVIGSLLALATLRRGAWLALTTLIILFTAGMAAVFLSLCAEDSRAVALTLSADFHGLTLGALKAAFIIMAAGSLISGHPRKTGFAFAFCLLLAPAVLGRMLGPLSGGALAGWMREIGGMPALACGALAILPIGVLLILIPARRLAFDDGPRLRHAPQNHPPAPVQAWIPAAIGFVTLAALAGIFILSDPYRLGDGWRSERTGLVFLTLFLLFLLLAGLVCIVFWFYRIHKQLAALIPSQSLLTPAAAVVFVLLAPLGMAMALLMLRDALDEYTAESNLPSTPISAWFVVWVLFFFPVAMGMIQHKANRINPPSSETKPGWGEP